METSASHVQQTNLLSQVPNNVKTVRPHLHPLVAKIASRALPINILMEQVMHVKLAPQIIFLLQVAIAEYVPKIPNDLWKGPVVLLVLLVKTHKVELAVILGKLYPTHQSSRSSFCEWGSLYHLPGWSRCIPRPWQLHRLSSGSNV